MPYEKARATAKDWATATLKVCKIIRDGFLGALREAQIRLRTTWGPDRGLKKSGRRSLDNDTRR